MTISKIDIAYAAGLFEGEGWVTRPSPTQIRVGINMCDIEPLQRMQAIFGGNLTGPTVPKNPAHTPQWLWTVNGWDGVEAVYARIGPWLSPRRTGQFQRALAHAPAHKELRYRGGYNLLKTECPKGHPLKGPNLYEDSRGARGCRICRTAAARAYKIRQSQ